MIHTDGINTIANRVLHPSEQAQLIRAGVLNRNTGDPLVAPGSLEEELALERIDDLRREESRRMDESFDARRKRFARRLHQHGLDPRETGRA